MNIHALWISRDPGFNRLKTAMGGMSSVIFTLVFGIFILDLKPLTLVFAALIAALSFLRLHGEGTRARMRSAFYALVILLFGAVIGLVLPKIFWIDLSVMLAAVFVAFYVLNYGPQFVFHPVCAVVLLLLGSSMQVPAGSESPLYNLIMLSCISWGFHFLIYFFLLKESALFGVRDQVYSLLCLCEESLILTRAGEEPAALRVLARATRRMDQWQLSNMDMRTANQYESARINLYGMLRVLALWVESHQQIHRQFARAHNVLERAGSYEQIISQELIMLRVKLLGKRFSTPTEKLPERPVLTLVEAFQIPPPVERLMPLYHFGFSLLRVHELLEAISRDILGVS